MAKIIKIAVIFVVVALGPVAAENHAESLRTDSTATYAEYNGVKVTWEEVYSDEFEGVPPLPAFADGNDYELRAQAIAKVKAKAAQK